MPSANYYMNFTCADPLHMANIYSVRTTIFSATILKRELQNLQRHFCTSTTTVQYPRGSLQFYYDIIIPNLFSE